MENPIDICNTLHDVSDKATSVAYRLAHGTQYLGCKYDFDLQAHSMASHAFVKLANDIVREIDGEDLADDVAYRFERSREYPRSQYRFN